jgi:2'-5' RNA ligase
VTDRPLRADDTFIHRPGDETWTSPRTAVLGVVVSIPEPWAQLLVEWRGKCGDPQASLVPPHVTLLPPTEVPIGRRAEISAHLARVAATHAPFDLHLAGTDSFRPVSEVVFVAVARGVAECARIASDVRTGPLARPLTFPYHPHVTVAHDVPTDMLDMASSGLSELQAEFRVSSFTEFEQVPGGAWAVAREYPLTGAPR